MSLWRQSLPAPYQMRRLLWTVEVLTKRRKQLHLPKNLTVWFWRWADEMTRALGVSADAWRLCDVDARDVRAGLRVTSGALDPFAR